MGQRKVKDATLAQAGSDERRGGTRRDATALGPVVARLVGGSEVRLIDFSRRGVLLESDTRLLIGAKATIKITTTDTHVAVRGHVVRSRVAGVKSGVLMYHTALALDDDLSSLEQAAQLRERLSSPAQDAADAADPVSDTSLSGSEDASAPEAVTVPDMATPDPVLEFLATVPHDLAELRRRASVNNW